MSDTTIQILLTISGIGLVMWLDVIAYEHGRRDGIREEQSRKIHWIRIGKARNR